MRNRKEQERFTVMLQDLPEVVSVGGMCVDTGGTAVVIGGAFVDTGGTCVDTGGI